MLGVLLFAVAFAFVVTSSLKMMHADAEANVLLGTPISNIVSIVYHDILVVSAIVRAIWPHAPTPSLSPLVSVDNAIFLFFYMLCFLAAALWNAARALARTVEEVKREVEKAALRRSMEGKPLPPVQENVQFNPPRKATLGGRFTELVVAPTFVGLLVAFILYVLGIRRPRRDRECAGTASRDDPCARSYSRRD
jgi:hypothetical protein